MKRDEVMAELERLGTEQTRKTWTNHGCRLPMYGVRIGDMQPLAKRHKGDTALARELWATGNGDARYLAGLIGNGRDLSAVELDEWAAESGWGMLAEYTVPWLASEHPEGFALALRWIDSPEELVSSAGWGAISAWVSVTPDERLDHEALAALLDRIAATIHAAPNRTRYTMNGAVIAIGSFVPSLTEKAVATAKTYGKVTVDMGGTACKVPAAPEYIAKVGAKGGIGKKRKTAKC